MSDLSVDSFQYALQSADGDTLHHVGQGLEIRAVPHVPKLQLQVSLNCVLDIAKLIADIAIILPATALDAVAETQTAYWLSPNKWLVLNSSLGGAEILGVLRKVSGGATASVIDVSDQWSVLEVTGQNVLSRLAEGCSLDLDPSVFSAGHYSLTRLQNLAVILHCLDTSPRVRVLVDRSFARFLWDWIMGGN